MVQSIDQLMHSTLADRLDPLWLHRKIDLVCNEYKSRNKQERKALLNELCAKLNPNDLAILKSKRNISKALSIA